MSKTKIGRPAAPVGVGLLDTVHDAVHGPIDLRDEYEQPIGPVILRLVNAPFLSRLRLIKQLSYSSHFVTSADHCRFAHALGTMHVMRLLMRTLKHSASFNSNALFRALEANFPNWVGKSDSKNSERRYQCLTQHMLLAGLLQDVGEIPSNVATSYFCYPGIEFHEALKPFTFRSDSLQNKELIGLGLIAEHLASGEQRDIKNSSCWQLVFSLISGRLPDGEPLPASLKCLYHLVDGEVDADRIDYVHRDAFHCLGEKVSPFALIHSLATVDEDGPVFDNPAAVSFFYVLRARLWSSVYFSPQNRFRLSLLLTVVRGALRITDKSIRGRICEKLFKTKTPEEMTIAKFMGFHDPQLTLGILELAKDSVDLRPKLGQKASLALQLLAGSASPDYECIWSTASPGNSAVIEDVEVPNNVFFDTFSDYTSVKSFRKGSVRVQSPEFRFRSNSTVFLEDAGGPFQPWFEAEPCPAPMPAPYSVLVYLPRVNAGDVAAFVKKCETSPDSVISKALEENPFVPFELHDTRKVPGFSGPNIFISFCWRDILLVRRVLVVLYQMKRRYFAITSSTYGIGNSAQKNSEEAARNADAAIIVASEAYCERLKVANSPLRAEMEILRERRARERNSLRCPVLSVCNFGEIKEEFPFEYVSDDRKHFPYVGRELARAVGWELHEVVRSALVFIDTPER